MLPCDYCNKDISLQAAVLSQDLNAETLAFCSVACENLWIEQMFAPELKSRAAGVTQQQA